MKRNTAQLKGNLIQAGIEQICQHGIDNLSLRTVLQKSRITHGAPYKHFGSKDGTSELSYHVFLIFGPMRFSLASRHSHQREMN